MTDFGLHPGTFEIESAGPITFGPQGILFVADSVGARVWAIQTDESAIADASGPFDMDGIDSKFAGFLGCRVEDLTIRDMAVHPASGIIYFSVQRGKGAGGRCVLLTVNRTDSSIVDVAFENIPMSFFSFNDAPAVDDERLDTTLPLGNEGEEIPVGERTIRVLRQPIRTATITDMVYVDGVLLVAGLSNEEFSSKLRRIEFPFGTAATATNLEIFHVSHGKWETASPIRAFVPYNEGRNILATYTCTPLVTFDITNVTEGTKTVGTTVAELGPVNQPLDMVSFHARGEEFLLIANSAHGLMRVACRDIDSQAALTTPTEPTGVAHTRETMEGVTRLASLDDDYVLALCTDASGARHLRSLKVGSQEMATASR